MNYSKYKFTLNVQREASQRSIPVKLNDTARSLYISLCDGPLPYYIPDGCRAVFFAKKPDGSELINDCIIENNTSARYDFTPNTSNVSGIVKCELRIYGADGMLLTGPKFVMVVDSRVINDDSSHLSESESTAWDNILLAEQQRVSAEEVREKAELDREITFEAASRYIDSAIDNANTVANILNSKLASGEFNGKDGKDGKDYVLTDEDKTEIANLVLAEFPIAEEISV